MLIRKYVWQGGDRGGNGRCVCKQWAGWDFFFSFPFLLVVAWGCLFSRAEAIYWRRCPPCRRVYTVPVQRHSSWTLAKNILGGLPLTSAWEDHRFRPQPGPMGASTTKTGSRPSQTNSECLIWSLYVVFQLWPSCEMHSLRHTCLNCLETIFWPYLLYGLEGCNLTFDWVPTLNAHFQYTLLVIWAPNTVFNTDWLWLDILRAQKCCSAVLVCYLSSCCRSMDFKNSVHSDLWPLTP